MRKRLVAVALVAACASAGLATPAAAHPLGNFSVNHFHGLRLHTDHIEDHAVVDEAEIPTLQSRPTLDADGDGVLGAGERDRAAAEGCAAVAAAVRLRVDGTALTWTVDAHRHTVLPGAAGLETTRLECDLRADADLSRPASVEFTDTYRGDRVGWHEITAVGAGVRLSGDPVRATSISNELRTYPEDLLASPLDERTLSLRAAPGAGGSDTVAPALPTDDPVGRWLGRLTATFNDLVAAPDLTLPVGLLAVLLALLLGAGHALLPGHGKTVMAAYIAGRRGTTRDAITVGATVTATHTAGVLVLGGALTMVAGLAGEAVLSWLGVLSGLIIAGVGVWLLTPALAARRRRVTASAPAPGLVAVGAPAANQAAHSHIDSHDHGPGHSHENDHSHGHSHGHHHHHHGWSKRRGLLGMGIAGGLVPSPSALVVLLGAIALGRTWFGILLVIAYGLGMAVVLTAAGLLLIKIHNRLGPLLGRRLARVAGPLTAAMPVLTATLVLVVGLALALRGGLSLVGPS